MFSLTLLVCSFFTVCCSMLIRSHRQVECTEACLQGEYCTKDECKPCPNGTYMTEFMHHRTYCKPWTKKPSHNAIIILNGTASSDIVWECEDGFEKKEFTAGGTWECIRITTTTITTTTRTSVSSSSSSSASIATNKTTNPHKAQDSDVLKIAAVSLTVSVFFITGITVFFVVRYRYKKNHQRQEVEIDTFRNNPELQQLYYKIVEVIGVGECSRFFLELHNESNNFNRRLFKLEPENCIEHFIKWENLNPGIEHTIRIIEALEKINYRLPGTHLTNPAAAIDSLSKAQNLNNEFRKFCLVLCEELGADTEQFIDRLNLRYMYDLSKSHSSTTTTQMAFVDCLAKWSFNHRFEDKEWPPLTIMQKELKDWEKKYILDNWSELTKKVNEIYKSFKANQNGACNNISV